jgi:hypothetical protein
VTAGYWLVVSGMAHRIWAAALGLPMLWSQASTAQAQEAETAVANPEPAVALVERGIALRRTGEDAAALPLFQEAERLDPESVRIKVHLAATHQALGEWEAADRYLTAALQNPSHPYIQRHESTLATARRTIDSHMGSLRVLGGPQGTQVRLNGRLVGTLPMDETIRAEAGIYSLEATLPGHYSVTRSVALAGGAASRESIQLAPLTSRTPTKEQPSAWGGANWLTWTFGGLAVGAGAVTVFSWLTRERHADNWNDDADCLAPGRTREQLCGDDLDAGKRAETGMWIGGGATVALAAASVATLWFSGDDTETSATALGCGVGWSQVTCRGHF